MAALLKLVVAASLFAAAPVPSAPPAVYRIDTGHSDVTFRIRHFMSRVSGTFNQWEGTITADPADWTTGTVEVTIQAASIDTRHERRDNDLRSDNFFDVATHPTITFRSTSVTVDGSRLTIAGDLTMRGITKPVVLEGEFLGRMGEGTARERIGFAARTRIDRTDFGVTWNRAVEGGGVMLGDDVDIEIAVEAVKRQE